MGGWLPYALRRRDLHRARRIALWAVVVAVAAALVLPRLGRPPWDFFDLKVYRGAVQWWMGGESLYTFARGHTGYGFTYPPFAGLVLAPLALGRWQVQAGLLTAASLAVVVVTTTRFFAPVARRAGWRPVVAVSLAVAVTLMMSPVKETLAFGQINLLLVALVLADVVALRRGWRWAGAGTGLAAAIKLTPAIFVLYFLLTRRWRAAAVAILTFLAVTAAASAVAPHASLQFWTETLWDTARIGHVDKTSNQSLLGMLARIAGPTPPQLLWLVLAAATLAFGMWRARRAFLHGDELVGLTLTGLTAALVSPISWTHHLYWLVPAVIVLTDMAAGRPVVPGWPWSQLSQRGTARVAGLAAAVITIACCSEVIWFFQRDVGLTHVGGVLGTLGENTLALAMVAVVAALPPRANTWLSAAAPSAARTTALPLPGGWSPR
jgi:alpha-1,2-mannosyltransferase